jgi:hypothetical protein
VYVRLLSLNEIEVRGQLHVPASIASMTHESETGLERRRRGLIEELSPHVSAGLRVENPRNMSQMIFQSNNKPHTAFALGRDR